jgi:glutamyl-tRNA synthetase
MIPHIEEAIRREIIYTALKNGVINEKPVFGAIMKAHADELKSVMGELRERIASIATEYRSLDEEAIRAEAQRLGVEYVAKDTTKEMVALEVDDSFRVRIAPEPSKRLHVGHAIHSFINAIYAERYDGSLVLRFEDTNPLLAKSEYVEAIGEDFRYLSLTPDVTCFASDYMVEFYAAITRLLEQGDAYACFCDRESMAQMRREGRTCACREKDASEHIIEFENMCSGVYEPGDVVIRLTSDMEHKNSAMRDPVLARIIIASHYRHGDTYRVWPLYDLVNVVMDAHDSITHIIRDNAFGEMRAELQGVLREKLGFPRLRVYQYGRFRIEGKETSGRAIREGILSGAYSGWDDPRLATLAAMKRRGFVAETFRDIAREVGLSPTQTRIDDKMLAKYNRRHVDRLAKRYSFVYDPVAITIEDYDERIVHLKSHPERETSDRTLRATGSFLIRSDDSKLERFRLIEAGNIMRTGSTYTLASESIDEFRRQGGSAIINWLATDEHRSCRIILPDGSTLDGLVEPSIAHEPVGSIVQLERHGFCRIDAQESDRTVLWYAHS